MPECLAQNYLLGHAFRGEDPFATNPSRRRLEEEEKNQEEEHEEDREEENEESAREKRDKSPLVDLSKGRLIGV